MTRGQPGVLAMVLVPARYLQPPFGPRRWVYRPQTLCCLRYVQAKYPLSTKNRLHTAH
jgi:hypothetical protein